MKKICFAFALLMGFRCFSLPSFKEIHSALDQGKRAPAKKLPKIRISGNPEDAVATAYLGDIAGFEKNWKPAISLYKSLL